MVHDIPSLVVSRLEHCEEVCLVLSTEAFTTEYRAPVKYLENTDRLLTPNLEELIVITVMITVENLEHIHISILTSNR